MDAAARAGALLTIDLGAVVANWRLLRDRVAPAECSAVVKADAYGLGVACVAPALLRAGCRTFFVATMDEGLALRGVLAGAGGEASKATVFVLNGLPCGGEEEFRAHRLIPVLNTAADIDVWAAAARSIGTRLPAALHVDTGMSRLGLTPAELRVLAENPTRIEGIAPALLMSHLACADRPSHPLIAEQLAAFQAAVVILPAASRSLANSSGIFLGPAFHFDMVRPGAALYGIAPRPGEPNPMRQVVRLQGRILQVREIDPPSTVGYGATWRAPGRRRIATVAVGYADGYLRALSNRGGGYIGETRVSVVGRVSMDLTTFDVSEAPQASAQPGMFIELIGHANPVDAVAADAGTIGYEVLTALGTRYHRTYVRDEGEVAR